jgi:predicted AlkP superfamily pyrophosphatase or phosphodiesterase
MELQEALIVPAYGGACIDGVVRAVLHRDHEAPDWLPTPVLGAEQVVLLLLDGLGWDQLRERAHLAPNMAAMLGGPITTTAPSTTATALTTLATGATPSRHGVVGYRMCVEEGVLNSLRWSTGRGDARDRIPPTSFQRIEPFFGTKPPVIARAELLGSGFTAAHLAGVRLHGWRMASTLAVTVKRLLDDGESFVYAYYEGIDKVAHEYGFGPEYDAELQAADRLIGDLLAALPAGAALLVVSDHGQVDVGDNVVVVHDDVMQFVSKMSGEGRFRWLHARPSCEEDLRLSALEHHGQVAWIRSRDEVVDERWFGGDVSDEVRARLGDVALVAREPVAFFDPDDTGIFDLRSRHGSLTSAEMRVPLLAGRA